MLKNIKNAIGILEVEQVNKNLPTGWQFSISTKTIIEKVREPSSSNKAEIASDLKQSVDYIEFDIC